MACHGQQEYHIPLYSQTPSIHRVLRWFTSRRLQRFVCRYQPFDNCL